MVLIVNLYSVNAASLVLDPCSVRSLAGSVFVMPMSLGEGVIGAGLVTPVSRVAEVSDYLVPEYHFRDYCACASSRYWHRVSFPKVSK